MAEPLDILRVERIAGCGMIVHFTDGTMAFYPAEELARLRPYRTTMEEVVH